jgi:hypoxanthine phosphoribosyltransferase
MPPKHPPDKHEVPSWEKIYWLCLKVAEDIKRSGFKPDVLVAISRGGWIPGRILSDLLENPNIATIKVEHYVDIYKRIPRPQITQPLPIDVSGKSVLLIDDIADSGKSLQLVREHLLKSGVKEVRIAALYCKPWSVVVPDFYAEETDAWIWFPHERFETAKKMVARLLREGKGEREIRKKLIKIGLKAWLVEKFLRWMRDQGFLPESK